jgi:hypothetical protein
MSGGISTVRAQRFVVLVVAAAVAVFLLLGGAARAQADTDVCSYSFSHPNQVTSKIHFGTKTIYNQDDSDQLVCSGDFGAPDGVELSGSAKCDIIASVYALANPAESWIGATDCALVTLSTGGGAKGVAEDALCGYLADAFGVGVGLFSAGATGNPAIGVAVWKGVTFFGNTAACVGSRTERRRHGVSSTSHSMRSP